MRAQHRVPLRFLGVPGAEEWGAAVTQAEDRAGLERLGWVPAARAEEQGAAVISAKGRAGSERLGSALVARAEERRAVVTRAGGRADLEPMDSVEQVPGKRLYPTRTPLAPRYRRIPSSDYCTIPGIR
jgi:hypothetical protein